MKTIITITLFLMTFAPWLLAAERKPNIVVILTDDQGYGDISAHGHPLLKTPNMDRLCEQSVRFENFSVSSTCAPTRSALMTGIHEFSNGISHTIKGRTNLRLDAVLLPQLLKNAGYVTGMVGKWHLGNIEQDAPEPYWPTSRGFDWWSSAPQCVYGGHHFNPDIVRNGVRRAARGFREDLFTDEAIAFLDQNKDKPFFFYFAPYSVHVPIAAPEIFIKPYRGKVDDQFATYFGMVANLDYNVGRLLDHLAKLGLTDNTIVIFMNDNGIAPNWSTFYNAGMRGRKGTSWQGGWRATSFWRWPGRWKAHAVTQLTAHLDVLPTLCDLVGVPIPATLKPRLQGFSLRPLLENDRNPDWAHDDRMIFQNVGRWPDGQAAAYKYSGAAVIQGNHLLISAVGNDKPAPSNKANWRLFDLSKDKPCRKNLAPQEPESTRKLATAYEAWWNATYPDLVQWGGDGLKAAAALRERERTK